MDTKIYSKTFLWLCVGLLITFLTGIYVSNNENMIYNIFSTSAYWIIFAAELFLVVFLSARIQKMKYTTAIVCYALYSFVSGLTFASVFVLFELSSILLVFAVTAVVFALFGAFGYFTKIDLSKMGTIIFMGLIALVIMTLINLFLGNSTFDIVICIIGIIVFVGYIAYDVQKLKTLSTVIDEEKLPIYGALQLYLDFINLFLYLIRLLGKRND